MPEPRRAPRLVEVGPRDGLQSAASPAPLAAKVAYVDKLSASGLKEIEAGSFVSPKAVPLMADSEEVFARIARRPGVVYSALVPNERGLERALAARAGKIAVFTAATETFCAKNCGGTISETLRRFSPVVAGALRAGLPARGYVSTAFHCPFEGPVRPAAAAEVCRRLLDLGVGEISVGDTIGRATADETRRLLDELLRFAPLDAVFLHFHDTYGRAVENALTAWREYGVWGFDGSAGGVGGCPYAPGAPGNAATEALAEAFRAAGADCGVDAAALREAAREVAPYARAALPKPAPRAG